MRSFRKSSFILKITLDSIIVIGIFFLSLYIVQSNSGIFVKSSIYFVLLSQIVVWFFASNAAGLYDEFRARNFSFEIIALIKSIAPQMLTLILILSLFKEIVLPRTFLIIFPSSLFVIIVSEKYIFRKILQIARKKGRNLRSIIIIGAGEIGEDFYKVIKDNPQFGYFFLGFLDDHDKSMMNGLYLGEIDKLPDVLDDNVVDDVIVALPNYAAERIEWVVNACEEHPTRVKIIPDLFKFVPGTKYNVSMFAKFPIISVREDRINELHWRILKRAFDTFCGFLCAILIFTWLFPLIAIVIKLSSQGPVFYKQERWGRNNKRFIVYKFRTMLAGSTETDENGKYRYAIKNDPRVTWIGQILRRTNFDELPQVINVLKGEMSIVGPRPHPTPLNMEAKKNVKQYLLRHLVKPGITGWAQIHGLRGEAEKSSVMQRRINYDIKYIENWSFQLDFQIILMTIWKMIKGDPHAY